MPPLQILCGAPLMRASMARNVRRKRPEIHPPNAVFQTRDSLQLTPTEFFPCQGRKIGANRSISKR